MNTNDKNGNEYEKRNVQNDKDKKQYYNKNKLK